MSRSARRIGDDGFTLVELLVTIMLTAVVTSAIFSVVMNTQRAQQFNEQMAEAMDQSRLVYERVRRELRQARVVDAANGSMVRFWLDGNADGLLSGSEMVTYAVVAVAGETDRYEVVRYTDDVGVNGASLLASVLRNPTPFSFDQPFVGDDPANDVDDPSTALDEEALISAVTLYFVYDVTTVRGPQPMETQATVRLRNVA